MEITESGLARLNTDRVYFIAEAGVNHNGSLDLAHRLVDLAIEAGADAVKFQTFRADELASADAPKADYQKRQTSEAESQRNMLRRLELKRDHHFVLAEYCRKNGIEFLSAPFDVESAIFLAKEVGVSRLKIPSGELTNGPLLVEAARTKLPLIVSTGMANLEEIHTALGLIRFGYDSPTGNPKLPIFAARTDLGRSLADRVTILHCVTEYPAPLEDVHLRAMDVLAETFAIPAGYSDHTIGISASIAAAARGARVIEKHFTLDQSLEGPDHKASVNPEELRLMIRLIRETERLLGVAKKAPQPSELKNIPIARKSLIAKKPIHTGEVFTAENLSSKRPGTGISPVEYWRLLGTRAKYDFSADEIIRE
jgi:N-acetylneuraminate synthase